MSKVTAKYQITIPQKIRDELNIVPGCEVDIAKEGDKYIIIVNPIQEIKNKWCGRFRDGKTTDQYINEIRGKIN